MDIYKNKMLGTVDYDQVCKGWRSWSVKRKNKVNSGVQDTFKGKNLVRKEDS